MAAEDRWVGRAPHVVFGCGAEELSPAQPHYDDSMRGRLVIHRRMDGRAAFLPAGTGGRGASSALCRLSFVPEGLVGKHGHGRCAASANAPSARDEWWGVA